MRVYAGMDPGLEVPGVIAHAKRVEALGYDGLHVAETVHDALAVASKSKMLGGPRKGDLDIDFLRLKV